MGTLFLSGCSATFQERDYSDENIPPGQIEFKDGDYYYRGDICIGNSLDSCLVIAKYKIGQNESVGG